MSTQQPLIDILRTDHLHADLKSRSVRGGFLTVTSQGTQFLISSVSTVVLARLLTPADFGLVAMVVAVMGLGQAFADLGLSEATIQSETINFNQVTVLFWINVAIGTTLTLIMMVMAPVLAWFYKEPRIQEITLIMSLSFLICGLRVQHEAILRRQMRFSALVVRDVFSLAVGVCVAVVMALRGAGYWALVAQPLISNLSQVLLSWVMVRWIPGLPHRDPNVRSMIAFGGNVAASYLIINVNRSADNALVGWFWGAGPLGLYSRAYNLLMLPVRQLSAPAGSVVIPTFSRIQSDPERFARYYLRAVNLIIWIAAPVFGFLFVEAQQVIALVLGPQWKESSPVFQILAISALGQLLLESTIWLFVSQGHSYRLLKMLLIVCPIIIASFVIGLPFGIKGVALSGSLVLIAMLPWMLKVAFRGTPLTLHRLGRAIIYPISSTLVGVIFTELVLHTFKQINSIERFALVAFGFLFVYSTACIIPSVRRELFSFRNLLTELTLSNQGT
jgi:O-antigen/teichoic acid export membrane protein